MSKVTKEELVEGLATRTGLTKAAADRVLKALFDAQDGLLVGALKGGAGAKVGVQGFGAFEVSHRPEHTTTRPGGTEIITIPARNVVRFKPGKTLKQSLNEPVSAPDPATS